MEGRSSLSRSWLAAIVMSLAVIAALLVAIDERDAIRLSEAAAEVTGDGDYPVFDDERALVRSLTLGGETRLSVTPPFPARVRFEVDVPDAAVLELATALVMMQQVERARVRYMVAVEVDGESTVVFDEVRTIADANQWQPVRIDLGAWSNRRVGLTLVAAPSPVRDVPWAGRVQVAWGEALVRASAPPAAATDATLDWLLDRADAFGADPVERVSLGRYGLNLALAGVASLLIGGVFRRLSADGGSDSLTRSFVMFTLTATFVVAVLRSSIALSLGLLGALSILRFRSPVRSSEHLLGLLACVAVALAFGTDQGLLGGVAVAGFAAMMMMRSTRAGVTRPRFLLTMSGPEPAGAGLLDRVEALGGDVSVESYDVIDGVAHVHAQLELEGSHEPKEVMADARAAFPDFRISFQAAGDS